MRILHLPPFLASLPLFAGIPVAAQGEIAYYKFDVADSTRVLNFAGGPQAAPVFGDTSGPASSAYADGRIGSALRGSISTAVPGGTLRTGWTGGHQGGLTIALFLKNRGANTPATDSPIAGQPSWSLASGGSAGAGLELEGWGGHALQLDLGSPLCMISGWNHFAVVIDPPNQTATWYHNGSKVSSEPIASEAILASQAEMLVGTDYVGQAASAYDIDEFRVLGRAAGAAEVAAWAGTTSAAVASFGGGGSGSAATRLDPLGVPVLGDPAFAVRVTGVPSSSFALIFGRSYARYAGRSLPLDLSQLAPVPAGTALRVAVDVTAGGALASGQADVGLPVPPQPVLAGFAIHTQAIALGPNGDLSASNAVALSVGR